MDEAAVKKKIEQARQERAVELSLVLDGITMLPPEIGQLTQLESLRIKGNQITALPPEVGQLTQLKDLDLRDNRIITLPPEVGQLTRLQSLDLGRNQLIALPPELWQLTQLIHLNLVANYLPALPPGIAQLARLQYLELSGNLLTALPPEVGELRQLQQLGLFGLGITGLPSNVWQLTRLILLVLSVNRLTTLPPEIGQLTQLRRLDIDHNQLTTLPPELWQLTQLRYLDLSDNQLTTLPPEIRQLTQLESLRIKGNQITALPPEVGQLTQLKVLGLTGNPLTSPPGSIVEQGTEAVLAFLRAQAESGTPQWVSKLLVVGEGRVGKTSLLRALRNEPFLDQQDSTHGIHIDTLPVQHPEKPDVTMQLNTWDFGGQEIYHATHQFFLSDRSLFLLAWNAGLGYEQAKLHYWLETIQALAPNSPILLVATWSDQREPDLPLSELKAKYPQLTVQVEISSRTGAGIDDLRAAIARLASQLPLMGQVWPTTWLQAANAIRDQAQKHITPDELWRVMTAQGVAATDQPVLSRLLHDLGDLLFFQDKEDLSNLVILKPQWVAEHISRVLDSAHVRAEQGIFTKFVMRALWHDLESDMQEHFLRLMEQFDLSYRTLEDKEVSLVVERLPLDPPDYQPLWDSVLTTNYSEIALKYKLSTIPAGVPSWSIARQHRFTTHTHWRNGAVFAYEPEHVHLGLLRASAHELTVHLAVRGPNPHNFFALLQDGLELTFKRFPGLGITRLVPCPCGGKNGQGCPHEYDYDLLQDRSHTKPTIECYVTGRDVPLSQLLFGLHWQMQDNMTEHLVKIQEAVAEVQTAVHQEGIKSREQVSAEFERLRGLIDQNTVLIQREFTKLFTIEQEKLDTYCPNVFTLYNPAGEKPASWTRRWLPLLRHNVIGDTLDLHLVCQAPGCWHPTQDGGIYHIERPAEWLGVVAPYVVLLVKFLKFTAPFVAPGLTIFGAQLGLENVKEVATDFEERIKQMEKLVERLPELDQAIIDVDINDGSDGVLVSADIVEAKLASVRSTQDCQTLLKYLDKGFGAEQMRHVHGRALRQVRQLIEAQDRKHGPEWGGLERILTPEGHYLWLCEAHAREYRD